MVWFGIFSSALWLALSNGNIHSASVKHDTESLHVITYLCDTDSLLLSVVLFLFLGHTIAREPLSHEETWNSPCGKGGWLTHIYCTMGKISWKGLLSGYPSQNNGIKCTHHKLCTLGYMEPHIQHMQYAGCWDQWTTIMDTQGTSGHKWSLIFQ